jgi:(S)-2-hydroxy-acid oxidase
MEPLHVAAMPHFINLEEVEAMAQAVLPKMVFDYYSGAAETQSVARENLRSFQSIKIVPRILRNVSNVDTSTRLFGG